MTLQERLGFSASDRLLIVHADDIGMCEATVSAWRALHGVSNMSSASAMAPCPWFPAAVQAAQEAGASADMGLHFTLNCEWRSQYRWGPITGNAAPASLSDDMGYFYPTAAETYQKARLELVYDELAAQLYRAQQLGLQLTHLDTHMMTALHPDLFKHVLRLSQATQLPVLIPHYRDPSLLAQESKMSLALSEQTSALIAAAQTSQQLAPIDAWAVLPFGQHLSDEARLIWADNVLKYYFAAPGVYGLIGHPAHDTVELRAVAPDWQTRVADFRLFASQGLRDVIAREGFHVIGMRDIAALWR